MRNRDIAEKLKISQGTVSKRLKKLSEDGIIEGYTCVLNHAAIGFGVLAFTLVRCKDQSADAVTTLLDFLKEKKVIAEIHKVLGDHDLVLKIWARDTKEYQRIIEEIPKGDNVDHIQSLLATETVLERRGLPSIEDTG